MARDSENFDVSLLSGVTSHKEPTRECANFPASLTSQVFMIKPSLSLGILSHDQAISSFFHLSLPSFAVSFLLSVKFLFSFIQKLVIPPYQDDFEPWGRLSSELKKSCQS